MNLLLLLEIQWFASKITKIKMQFIEVSQLDQAEILMMQSWLQHKIQLTNPGIKYKQ